MSNPQATSILERMHQVIAKLVRTFYLQNNYLYEDDSWSGILAATAFAVQSTYRTTLQVMPVHPVFGCDMVLNTPFIAEWGYIRLRKKNIIDKNNQLENNNHKPHTYRIQEKLLVHNKKANKYEETYVGNYPITHVWTNGNITILCGAVQEHINIR